ncbi:MAG TPA: hemolysin family protein [Symbiobacteriaceae bacterium]|nr:hemolysin family protein [Symbiobacteriaceae bacterium]
MGQYWQEFTLIAALILINAFFAAAEIAVVSSRHVRIRQMAEQGNRSAKAVLRLMEDHSRFLATIQVGITLAGFLASASAAVGLSEDFGRFLQGFGLASGAAESAALVIVTLVLSYFTLVLGELVPKRMALQAPERIALIVAPAVGFLSRVTGPFTALLTKSTNLVVRLLGGKVEQKDESISEEELRFYVEEHEELEDAEKKIISGVFDFGDRLVRQVMVPRPDMECIHQDATLLAAMEQVRKHGYWRYPVYREDYDDIVGIITVKDLVFHVDGRAAETPVSSIMRPMRVVPESKHALALLKEMQVADEQMAIVIDEYGGVAGLVTLEDLLQEIVGEVAEEPPDRNGGPTEQLLDATDTVEEIVDRLDIPLAQSPNYETLAGYILHALGAVPSVGATLEVGGWRLVVAQMDGHRIDKVKAIPILNPVPGSEQVGEP